MALTNDTSIRRMSNKTLKQFEYLFNLFTSEILFHESPAILRDCPQSSRNLICCEKQQTKLEAYTYMAPTNDTSVCKGHLATTSTSTYKGHLAIQLLPLHTKAPLRDDDRSSPPPRLTLPHINPRGCFSHSLCPAPSSMEAKLVSFCSKPLALPQLTGTLWLVGGSQLCAVVIQ